ncbi:MAG: lipoyl(octanoyl) transferase LipB [Bacteroidales bacterium]|nr:lipoyl(octanoyl) transferase LipB [Bacteroidales bacterium]
MIKQADYIDLGVKEYKEAWDFQEDRLALTLKHRDEPGGDSDVGTLILCEHPHVYTLGKSGQQNNLLIQDEFLKKINATYYRSNRGGDITYHGPGQIVGYPIFDLEKLGLGVKEYVHRLEESIIRTLAEYEIPARRLEGATGVWLDTGTPRARKICAIGVRVSRAITMHGFALNVNTDLSYFSHINPCGFIDKGVTSIQQEKGNPIPFEEAKNKVKAHIGEIFGIAID